MQPAPQCRLLVTEQVTWNKAHNTDMQEGAYTVKHPCWDSDSEPVREAITRNKEELPGSMAECLLMGCAC